jgi:hypothetical protein
MHAVAGGRGERAEMSVPGSPDLVEQARHFATQAHQRIDHRRKYSRQPYHVHLEAVAGLVASVSDDAEMIAAAWLHDTVEDTPATLNDIEQQFGVAVAELVEELTDVSKPGDGNRAHRKAIDRRHSAQASARAKTVKLADLIDNCRDITAHDPGLARIYLAEMGALLEVLQEGDARLLERARAPFGRDPCAHPARLLFRQPAWPGQRCLRRDDMNKPMVRMWLFGFVTIIEMGLVDAIRVSYPGNQWQTLVSAGRLEKARQIQAERQRRNQYCDLLDCLQLSDKGQILVENTAFLKDLGFESRSAARRVVKELESLRNHLAHAQDIVTHDWAQIARMTQNIEELTSH